MLTKAELSKIRHKVEVLRAKNPSGPKQDIEILLDHIDELRQRASELADAYEAEGHELWGNSAVLTDMRKALDEPLTKRR